MSTELPSQPAERFEPSSEAIEKVVMSLAHALDVHTTEGVTVASLGDDRPESAVDTLLRLSQHIGIFLKEVPYNSVAECFALVQQGYPLLFQLGSGELLVVEGYEGSVFNCMLVGTRIEHAPLSKRLFRERLGDEKMQMFVAKKELEVESFATPASRTSVDSNGKTATPYERLSALMNLDKRDIALVMLFASVAGVLSLATPLVIESLVGVVSWGTYVQPLLVLALLLMGCLGLSGVFRVLQTVIVEIIQRRQFVRIVSDLSHRFPRANRQQLDGKYPRELSNRLFDIMTIQKATATLLLDGVSIILTTTLGLILLAFYHPFLLGFDIVLLLTMAGMTLALGRGGVKTAIVESKTKYKVVHWLQDVLAMPGAFKAGGGESLAVRRANQLVVDYLSARKKQFAVVIRQVIFAVSLQVIASTALLGLGGWLVINGELTLGQLVASELVVTVVVGAFAKAGKSLEKFYDMMAGIDKVGQLVDLMPDPRTEVGTFPTGPLGVQWQGIQFRSATGSLPLADCKIEPGTTVALYGGSRSAKTRLADAIAGLTLPATGSVRIEGLDAMDTALASPGEFVGYAGQPEIFHGTLRENVDLGRRTMTINCVREALDHVGLTEIVARLTDGLDTPLQTNGSPLSHSQQCQLMIARAIGGKPRVIVIDGLLDSLSITLRSEILTYLKGQLDRWTVIVATEREDIASACDEQITLHQSS